MKKATDDDVAALIAYTERARDASRSTWPWATLARHLVELGGFAKDAAQKEAHRCRIVAALGCYPDGCNDFIALWLSAHGIRLATAGSFLGCAKPACWSRRRFAEIEVWTEDMRAFKSGYERRSSSGPRPSA